MNVIVCYAKCYACTSGFHYNPPRKHIWADEEDVQHAKDSGREAPTGLCACPCAHGSVVPADEDEELEAELESLNVAPCPVCESRNACAWDADGRPMIHAVPSLEDNDV